MDQSHTIINKNKTATQHRIDSGLSYHIQCTGITKIKNRGEAYKEVEYWKDTLKRMCQYLRSQNCRIAAEDLERDMTFYTDASNNALMVNIAPESWHIFTYALRAVDGRGYYRLMSRLKSPGRVGIGMEGRRGWHKLNG